MALFFDSKLATIGMAMVGAGAMGNIVDRFLFSGMVKDIIYTP
jgi:lipoprotein signal peptidase